MNDALVNQKEVENLNNEISTLTNLNNQLIQEKSVIEMKLQKRNKKLNKMK